MFFVFVVVFAVLFFVVCLSSFSKTLAGTFLLVELLAIAAVVDIADNEDVGGSFVAAGCVDITSLESLRLNHSVSNGK